MGLAERFRENLDSTDIFKTSDTVSNPIKYSNKFEDLETTIIDKIRKTPYWSEYSTMQKENMIKAYFGKKVQALEYSQGEKDEFVQNIMTLANHQ
jgi:hypothetical protein